MQLEKFAFAVELFFVIFSAICWFFYTPVETQTDQKIIAHQKVADVSVTSNVLQTISPKITAHDEIIGFDNYSAPENVSLLQSPNETVKPNTGSERWSKDDLYIAIIDDLKLPEARKVASLLKEKQVIHLETKLSGKGKTREWLAQLIKDQLLLHQAAVKEVLSQVCNVNLI